MCLSNGDGDIFQVYNLSSRCSITSPATMAYNSCAWAAGEDERNWQPLPLGQYYWPVGISKDNPFTLSTYIELYRLLGFQETPGNPVDYERGLERIAIYIDNANRVSHVARQITDEVISRYPSRKDFRRDKGKWTSKIVDKEDICHDRVSDIEGILGHVVVVMTRPSEL